MKKPKFRKKTLDKSRKPLSDFKIAEKRKPDEKQDRLLEAKALMNEWVLSNSKLSPRQYLIEKGLSEKLVKIYFKYFPREKWVEKAKHYQDEVVKKSLDERAQFVKEINEQHMTASKIGLAKALEMLTQMKVESKRGSDGVLNFHRFKTTDLKNCLESVGLAQKIMRTALGLPTDEGAINVWNQMSVNMDSPKVKDDKVQRVTETYEYEEIMKLVEFRRQKVREKQDGQQTIDVN